MNSRPFNRRDIASLAFAALATLFTTLTSPSPQLAAEPAATVESPAPTSEPALDALLDIDSAQQQGAWWLDASHVDARLSFAPEHDRLVWQVDSADRSVLLDAKTGEALEFGWF